MLTLETLPSTPTRATPLLLLTQLLSLKSPFTALLWAALDYFE